MENRKFVGRKEEQEILSNISKEFFFIVIKGRRRIGKTTLIQNFYKNNIYMFVWPNKSIDWIRKEFCQENNIPEFSKLIDVIKYILDKNQVLFIDEFQNFLNVDKSFYGELQKLIDEYKLKGKTLKLIVSGSSYSLMGKVFNNVASPLYGRKTYEMTLDSLEFNDLSILYNKSFKDLIEIWSVFEGIPYYYEFLDSKLDAKTQIKNLFFNKFSQLREEGRTIVAIEFGADSKTYNTILSAISSGKTKLSEISSLFGNKKTETSKYLDLLRKEFNMVVRETPILSNPRTSKEGIYLIKDNLLSFWYYFVDKQRVYFEQERFEELELFFQTQFNSFVGRKFEKLILNLIKTKKINLNFQFDKIGSQWGNYLNENKEKKVYEIDICAINEDKKEILFGEVKWQDNVNTEQILKELKEKSTHVKWNNEERKEEYIIFARSFKSKKLKGCKCYDLKDIEKIFKPIL